MTRKEWKAFKRWKIPLLSAQQRKAKSPFEIRQIREAGNRRLGQFFVYTEMNVLYIFSSTLIQKTISHGARRNVMFLPLSKWSKVRRWWCGVAWLVVWLTKLHMLPTGQTLTSEYHINQILEKVVKPLTSRRQVTHGPIENIWSIIDETTYKIQPTKWRKSWKGDYALYGKIWLLTR